MQQIVVESSYGSIWREIMEGITRYAADRRRAWKINCVTTQELAGAIAGRPSGAICTLRNSQRALIRQLIASRIPAVNLLRDIHPAIPCVMSNNQTIGELAADYLYGKGYRRFEFVGVDRVWSQDRERGYRKRLAKLGQESARCPVPLKIASLRMSARPAVLRSLTDWVTTRPRPLAVFACADFVGAALIEACARAEIRVPEEAAVLGVDNDLAICDLTLVPLSSIPQNMRRIGFEAARLLNDLVQKRPKRRSVLAIAPREVVVRRSTDFIAIENPLVASAMRYITATEAGQLDLKHLLRELDVSRQWLDRKFRESIGSTPSEEMRRRKLAAIRSLLLDTHLSVQTIAIRSGFTQGENLARFFKEQLGISPREYRRRHGFVDHPAPEKPE